MVRLPYWSICCAVVPSSARQPTSVFEGFEANIPWLITPPEVAEMVYR